MKEIKFPALYEAADIASIEAQRNFLLSLISSLICFIIAAILSLINAKNSVFASIQVLVLLLSLSLTIYLVEREKPCF